MEDNKYTIQDYIEAISQMVEAGELEWVGMSPEGEPMLGLPEHKKNKKEDK
jgi:hypothetical protein